MALFNYDFILSYDQFIHTDNGAMEAESVSDISRNEAIEPS